MAGHIPETFIDELLTRVDIVDIIQSRIELKRAGTNFAARCPFHSEKSPSFTVSPSKQFYHCFGCGAHGNALKFLTEYDGLHFVDAIELLANRVGLVVPKESEENPDKTKKHAEIYATLETASRFYHKELLQGSAREKAIQYLKNRGITKETVLDFNLGYALSSWDALFKALGKDKNSHELLLAAGLIINKEKASYFDRFRDRIMFPIRNRRGQVTGFGGRILQEGNPKYLNSPETKVFSKSHELYGLYEARLKLKKLQTLVIVEGYLDVLTLSQFGVKNVVATLGTAFTEKHLEILFREVQELVFCFDGDKAGREAARRVLMICLPWMQEGRRIRFMLLPEQEDPDSFMRKMGKSVFEDGIEKAKNLSDFIFESFLTNLDLNQAEGRVEYIRRVRPLIAKIPSGILQRMLYERLSELTRVSLEQIENPNSGAPKPRSSSQPLPISAQKGQKTTKYRGQVPPAYKASALLLANPEFLGYIKTPHGLEKGTEPGTPLLCAIIDSLLDNPQLTIEKLLEKLSISEGLRKEISYIANFNDIIELVPSDGRQAEFMGALERLKERLHETALDAFLMRAKTAPLSFQEKIELKELLEQKEHGG